MLFLHLLVVSLVSSAASTATEGLQQAPSIGVDEALAGGSLPLWAKKAPFRQLLMSGGGGATASVGAIWAEDVVVAKDGSGNYTTITDALAAAPNKKHGTGRYVIRVKAGTYDETVNITKRNIVLLGDGIGKTIITGNKSNGTTNTPMYLTATVTALGHGFMAQALSIRNTAGLRGNQALAHRCRLEGFQDTVYAENNLQLYLGCDIYGTVDMIFGNAKAVFQSCRLLMRLPIPGGHNVITAQGRNCLGQDSGFVFQNCSVKAAEGVNLTGVDTYLGRPWKNCSHVVFMDCCLSDIVNAAGWEPWDRNRVVEATTRTVSYKEYRNWGPRADTTQRVKWDGFEAINKSSDVEGYTVDRFIHAKMWVPRQIHYSYVRREGPC